ncbi:MAG: hypothetical protein EGP73_00535 [Alistipes indistinctus]|nr:hypothetical protein [Alistipes indistinctus]
MPYRAVSRLPSCFGPWCIRGLSPGSAVAAFRVVAAAGLAAGKSCQDWLRFDCRDVPELAAARSRAAVPFAGSNG